MSRAVTTLRAVTTVRAATALALLVALCPIASAQVGAGGTPLEEGRVYRSLGAPADPKVEVHWNRYHDHARITEVMQELTRAYPDRSTLTSLGDSFGGRPLWVWRITAPVDGVDPDTKPGFYIDGGIHANELQGPEVVLYTGWYLLEAAARSPFLQRLLEERVFYLVPMLSPDSRDSHMYEPNTTHSPRSGQRPIDDDQDGLVDEDPPNDLDGDGSITRMRIRDPLGRMKPHPKYPNLMVEAEPDEPGGWRLLGWEGIDDDDDGRVNEDGAGFYDPNRDWAWQWQPAPVQWGAHRYPFSIGENRLVADFVKTRPNLAGAQSYHNSGGMILRGPGPKGHKVPREDLRAYDAIAKKGVEMLPGYRYLDVADGLYPVWGGEFDWFYNMRGVLTFTNELFTSFNLFRKQAQGGFFGSQEDLHRFDRLLLFEEGIVDWKEFDHPVYGKVEVGGLRKEWLRQPPSFLLEEECHRNMAFTLYHADQMPLVQVAETSVRALGSGVFEVTARIANPKITSTRLRLDRDRGLSLRDRVTIEGDGIEVITGLTSDAPEFQRPREQRREPATLRLESVPGMGAVSVRWVVKGEGPYTVTIRTEKGGRASAVAATE